MTPTAIDQKKPFLIHHRGRWEGQPQPNSFASLHAEAGSGIECDVICLDSGELVVVHPRDINKTTSEVENMMLRELNNHTQNLLGIAVPEFKEFVIKGIEHNIFLMIDIKGSDDEHSARTAKSVTLQLSEILKVRDFSRVLSIVSFSPTALKSARESIIEKNIIFPLWLQWSSSPDKALVSVRDKYTHASWEEEGIRAALSLDCAVISYLPIKKVTESIIHKAHQSGLDVIIGLIEDRETLKLYSEWGADYIVYELIKETE